MELGWWAIPTRGKVLLVTGATGHEGVVDESKLTEWTAAYADANTALRADGWIGIDVDAYDGKVGDQTLAALEAELGELPVTISSTSRGAEQPSRIHFYKIPDSAQRFITKFPDIEIIQRGHRYALVYPSVHPDGEERQYRFYGYEGELLEDLPAIDDLEALPDAWLERLSLPDAETPGAGYNGTVAEWLERAPQGNPGMFMSSRISEIPTTDFNHDQLVSLQASLVSLAAQGEPGVIPALAALRKEWLRPPYDTSDYARDWQVSLEGAIRKFGALPDRIEDVLGQDQASIAARIASDVFLTTWTTLPPVISDEALQERVARVMSIGFEEGLSVLEAASLGWHSAAAQHPAHGIRREGLEAVWALAQQVAANPVTRERDFAVEPAAKPEPTPGAKVHRRISLLSETEREEVGRYRWWGTQFMDVMRDMHPIMSEPYYRLNRWMILSLCLAHRAYIPLASGESIILNFYGVVLGPSKSGKSESLTPVKKIASMFWSIEENPDIGGDATSAALTQALIYRDGLPSLFHSDEADAVFRNWANQQGEFRGMKQRITEIYQGDVPAIQRSTHKDISGIHAKAYLNVHMTGIDEEIADSIEPRDWRSGFINRFVWAKGERKPRTRDQKRLKVRRGAAAKAEGSAWYMTWVNQFRAVGDLLAEPGHPQAALDIDEDVLDRHVETVEAFERVAQSSLYPDRLEPTFGRLETTILKCAALACVAERRRRIEMIDYLVALEQAEEWAENILDMVEATDETPRARQANRLYQMIETAGGRMSGVDIKKQKRYAGDAKFAQGLIQELVEQGRIELLPTAEGPVYRVKKEEK